MEQPIRILIVEDDPNIAKMIAATLAIGGYDSAICANGREAVERAAAEAFDLMLLDVMLPDMDGFTVIQHIRSDRLPVIFLTAMQDVADKVRGLKLGAEDYIVKPFEAVELLARVEVVLRRGRRQQERLTFRDIEVAVEEHVVRRGGMPVALTPKEFDLLVFFLRHPDIALTRERLLAAVWGYGFAGETRTVDIHVQQLRKKLGLQGVLTTIPKLGYRLER